MQDLGDKLRLVITAHRRIKISKQLFEDIDVTDLQEKGIKFLLYYKENFDIW